MALSMLYYVLAKDVYADSGDTSHVVSSMHLIDDIAYKKENYHALIEIPAGTRAKWEVNDKTGKLEWKLKKGKPRLVSFLGYPGNYGFIPQTVSGDGSPLDVIVLDSSVERGVVQNIKILGRIKLLDKGIRDDKIIAVPFSGAFKEVDTLKEMLVKFPGVLEIVHTWFEGYKGSKIQFIGYGGRKKSIRLIEKSHIKWKQKILN